MTWLVVALSRSADANRFSLRGFTAIFEIAQLIGLIYVTIRKNLFGRTVRDIRSVIVHVAQTDDCPASGPSRRSPTTRSPRQIMCVLSFDVPQQICVGQTGTVDAGYAIIVIA